MKNEEMWCSVRVVLLWLINEMKRRRREMCITDGEA
jgi:hypothetical protein